MTYGRAYIDFLDYTNELRAKGKEVPLKDRFKIENIGQTAVDSAGLMKSLKSFLDNSAIFRQGWKTMITNPGSWFKNAKATYGNIIRTIGGQNVLRDIRANIVSRANYDKMVKAGLDVGVSEEAFPTRGLEKLPVIGRLYKASETAYTGFLYKMRADVFDKYMDIGAKSGVDLADVVQLKSIGKMVNSLTGRGGLGQAEPVAKYLNNIFFSPRLLKANWDFLTAHQFQKGVSPFVRKQAATNLLKVVTATGAILTIAKAINPDSVETDPRSADFGKIKIGNTRFDVSGGMSSLVTLALRELTQSSKSSTTGLVSKLNSGEYGAQTGLDVVYNFFENKLSPVSALIKNLLQGEDFKGDKLTIGGTIYDLATPLTISNAIETANDPNAANLVLSLIADAHGISTNTYAFGTNWNNLSSKEMTSLKKRVGQERFDQMNRAYNRMVTQAIVEANKLDRYKMLSDDKKKDYIQRLKEQIKKQAMMGKTNF